MPNDTLPNPARSAAPHLDLVPKRFRRRFSSEESFYRDFSGDSCSLRKKVSQGYSCQGSEEALKLFCKTFSCRYCADARARYIYGHVYRGLEEARLRNEPCHFLTLTLEGDDSLERLRFYWSERLRKYLRRRNACGPDMEFATVLGHDGRLHLHGFIRGGKPISSQEFARKAKQAGFGKEANFQRVGSLSATGHSEEDSRRLAGYLADNVRRLHNAHARQPLGGYVQPFVASHGWQSKPPQES
jgi:hypothetical protein